MATNRPNQTVTPVDAATALAVIATQAIPCRGAHLIAVLLTATDTDTFSAAAWQYSEDGGVTWQSCAAADGGIGTTTAVVGAALNAGGHYALLHSGNTGFQVLPYELVRLSLTVGAADISGLAAISKRFDRS